MLNMSNHVKKCCSVEHEPPGRFEQRKHLQFSVSNLYREKHSQICSSP